jgi:drug/metabolite transporter (DMT)-like permease
MPKSNLKDYLHLHLIVFIWGFTAVLGKLISLDAIPLVWLRLVIALGFLFLYVLIKKENFTITNRQILQYLLSGLILGLHWITFFYAIKISNVSITLATLATGALFTSILEPLFFKKRIVLYEVLFSVMTVIGIIIIFNVEYQYKYGILVALFSAFLSALFAVLNANLIKKNEAIIISFYEILFAVGLITIALLIQNSLTLSVFKLSTSDWVYIFILGSICTAYALTASTKLLKKFSPFTMMLTINLEPVYGIILALIVFKKSETMTTTFYYGALLIFTTVILNGYIKSKRKQLKN